MSNHNHFLILQEVHVDVSHELHLKEESILLDARAVELNSPIFCFLGHICKAILKILFGYALQLQSVSNQSVDLQQLIKVLLLIFW